MFKISKILCISVILMVIMTACGTGGTSAISDELQAQINNNDNAILLEQDFNPPPSHMQYTSLRIDIEALGEISADPEIAEGVRAHLYAGNAVRIVPTLNAFLATGDAGDLADATLAAILTEYSLEGIDVIVVRANTENCPSCDFRYDLNEMTRERLEENPLQSLPTLTPEA